MKTMSTYTWNFGSSDAGLVFKIVFDAATGQFTVTALEGSINIGALWFSDGNSTSDGYTLTKADNSLNMNGTSTVWEDDGTASSEKLVWDSYLKDSLSTVLTAGQTQVLDAPEGFDPEVFGVLGVRATTSIGSIKWVDDSAQKVTLPAAPVLTVDNATVSLAFDALAGEIAGADADATDIDSEDAAITFALVGTVPQDGDANPLFSIDATTGQISLTAEGAAYIGSTGASFTSYALDVQASDGALTSNVETITIDVARPVPGPGQVLVFNADGGYVGTYGTIQAAIDASTAGSTVEVGAGTFSAAVNINKAITLIGVDAGVSGTGDRAEAGSVISGKITVNAAATIDGFTILNTTANTVAYDAIQVQTSGDVTILNNVFFSEGPNGSNSTIDRAVYLTTAATGNIVVDDNLFTGNATSSYNDANWTTAVWSDGKATTLLISDNEFQHVRTAMNLDGYDASKVTVTDNLITSAGSGISVGANAVGTVVTFGGITENTFGAVDTDFNLQNIGATKSVIMDLGATNNLATEGQLMVVLGSAGGDTITGTAGSDRLTGNLGGDTLTGGAGADTFVFNRAPGGTNVDSITDFSSAEGDKIALARTVFTAFTTTGQLAEGEFGTKVLYDSASGALSYDADGAGSGAAVQFATLSAGLSLTAGDFMIL
jgi:Ca2+-binding RTX toxin-like protein